MIYSLIPLNIHEEKLLNIEIVPSMMDYSDTVIVVVTTISAAIVVVLLALLYYIKCVLSRPVETDKASDWMTNPSPTSKTSIKSPKGGSENGEYIMNPSVSLRNSEKAKALSVDVETGAKTNSTPAVQPKSASKRFLDPVSIVASIMGRSQPSPAAASPAASSSARKSDGFGSFHFLDPAFASVVKGAKVEEAGLGLDTVLPLPQLSSAATATGSAVKKDQSSSPLPPPPEVAVKEATALTWSLDALPSQQSAPATSVSEPTPAPIIPDSIKQDLTPIEDFSSDPAGASAPAGETDGEAAAPVLSENEFDEAMTSKLMPPSASGPQKFSSDGLMPVDVQMSLAANKNLTAAERNTEYFKKMKEVTTI